MTEEEVLLVSFTVSDPFIIITNGNRTFFIYGFIQYRMPSGKYSYSSYIVTAVRLACRPVHSSLQLRHESAGESGSRQFHNWVTVALAQPVINIAAPLYLGTPMFCTVLFAGITITTLVITRVSPILIALCVVCTKHKKKFINFLLKS